MNGAYSTVEILRSTGPDLLISAGPPVHAMGDGHPTEPTFMQQERPQGFSVTLGVSITTSQLQARSLAATPRWPRRESLRLLHHP